MRSIEWKIAMASAGALVALAAAAPASAALIGADTIKISLASGPNYLQVAEVVATQSGTGTDVALAANGATASAPNQYAAAAPGYAIDGNVGGNYYTDGIYHSAGAAGDYLLVTLAAPANLSSLTIYGRTDCCTDRDNYQVVIDNAAGQQIYSGVLDGTQNPVVTVNFPGGVPEPATWSLMILGVAGIGASLRSRRRMAPVAL